MRRFARDSRGISEIVGTLMLVLIVVTAAAAFAAFVASYQKQLQAQQAQAHARSLESLHVLQVHPMTGTTAITVPVTAPSGTAATPRTYSHPVSGITLQFADPQIPNFQAGDTITVTSSAALAGSTVTMTFATGAVATNGATTGACIANEPTAVLHSPGCSYLIPPDSAPGSLVAISASDSNGIALGLLQLTLASLSVNPSGITGVLVDGAPLLTYAVSGSLVDTPNLTAPVQFKIAAFGQVSVSAVTALNPIALDITKFIKIEVLTSLENSFVQVLIPPVAVAQVSTIQTVNGTTPVTVPLLDGSKSFAAGNSTIVGWSWSVTQTHMGSGGCASGFGPVGGEQYVVPSSCHSTPVLSNYTAALTVTDSDGLIATSMVSFSY